MVRPGSAAAANDTMRTSCFVALALDITRAMGGIRCTYFATYKWYERNAIPAAYYDAIVAAAAARGFPGVTHAVLAGIKAREFAERKAGKAAVDKPGQDLTLAGWRLKQDRLTPPSDEARTQPVCPHRNTHFHRRRFSVLRRRFFLDQSLANRL